MPDRGWGQGRLLEIEEEDYFNNDDEEEGEREAKEGQSENGYAQYRST